MKNIFIVEDEQDIRETLQQALELEGYQVFGVANGQEGIELLQKIEKPCVILLDLMMPIMNGWQFVEVLNKNHQLSTIPVVVMTAYGDEAHRIKAQDFLKKPVDLDVLVKIVEKHC